MERNLDQIADRRHDLIIVGGGIFGACAAWDATLRGMSVALIDKGDFGGATSASSFKMAHGGIRYLQHADIVRVRSSCRERSALLRVAPHLVQPLPIAIPTYGHGRKGKEILGAAMLAYDLLTLDRNAGIPDPQRHIPRGRFLSRRETLAQFPNLEDRGLTGAAVFCDGQVYNGPRLALSFLRAAVDKGALAANYVQATGLRRDGDRITGVRARELVSGEELEIGGSAVLNAAGPWVPHVLRGTLSNQDLPQVPFSRDACFIVSQRLSSRLGLAVSGATKDPDALFSRSARHLFIVPWRDYSLVGVWHVVWRDHPDAVTVTKQELQAFLDEVNAACPGIDLDLSDVRAWNAGLVPFGENDPEVKHLRYGHRSHIIDHGAEHGLYGLVSLIGVRYTMARGDSARAIDLIVAGQGRRAPRPATERTRIFGGDFARFDELEDEARRASPIPLDDRVLRALLHNYGSAYGRVLDYVRQDSSLGETLDGTTVLKAEIVHAVREEMALELGDVAFRRTDLATGGDPGGGALCACADLMAREHSWSPAETQRQLEVVQGKLFRLDPGGRPDARTMGRGTSALQVAEPAAGE